MAVASVSVEAIQELHDYFSAKRDNIPPTLLITPAETVNDVIWLIDQCFGILSEEGVPERIRGMRLDMLKRIRNAMETPVAPATGVLL